MTNATKTNAEGGRDLQMNIADLESDIGHLVQLIDTVVETVYEKEIKDRSQQAFCLRVDALLWIARDLSIRLEKSCQNLPDRFECKS
jgi:hypothetical protein